MEQRVLQKLKNFTRHREVKIVSSGNLALFIALHSIKRKVILIPDQGGWISYKTYPLILNRKIREVRTNYGIIDLDSLKKTIEISSLLILPSFAGYFAEQPIKEISKICRENDCLLLEDASSSVSDEVLCNGNYSDVIIGSFGKYKPVNLGYGGFISSNQVLKNDIFSLSRIPDNIYSELNPLLTNNRLSYLLNLSKKVKQDLRNFEVLHKDRRGLNVVVKSHPSVIEYCNENHYPYLKCPNYSRVNEKAISIELKKL